MAQDGNVMAAHRFIAALAIALLCSFAQAEELPRSPACRTALQALDEAEDAIAATASAPAAQAADRQRQQVVAAKLQPLRQRVADACLGGLTTSPSPSQRSWVVPQAPARPGAIEHLPRPAAPTVALPRPEVPVSVTHCSGATCFATDGSILTRVGPQQLVGPRGSCTVQGNLLRCP